MRRPMFVLSLALASVLALPSTAQTAQTSQTVLAKRPMTFEDLMQMRRLGETAVSTDGRWLAYSVTTVNLEQNSKTAELFIQFVGGGDPKPLPVAQAGDHGPQFSPDGKHILFLSGRGGSQQVWVADFNTSDGAASNPKKLTAISTEADSAAWSSDSHSVVFTSSVYPDCPAITAGDMTTGDQCNARRDAALASNKVKAQLFTHLLYRHWDHYTGGKRSHLFLVSLEGGALRDLTPNVPRDVPPFSLEGGGCGCAFSPDSRELAFTENLDEEPATSVNADIFTLDLSDPAAKPERVSTSPGGDFNPAYSPDGSYLAWRSQARAGYESDRFRLVLYDRKTKKIKDLLPATLDNWVEEFAWTADSKSLLFTEDKRGETPIFITNLSGVFHEFAYKGEFSDLHPVDGGKALLVTSVQVQQPAEIIRIEYTWYTKAVPGYDIVTNDLSVKMYAITHLNDALLGQLELPPMESFWFSATDHTDVKGFLIKPPDFDPAKKYPVKFLIHGGPQGAWGDSWSYRWNPELFAANGYVVVMIDPRGSTGFGQTFVDGVNGDWGGKPYTDLMTGLDYVEQHYPFVDKSRECALGASYGGYMANWILGHSNRFKCIVSHDGMFDPESAYGSTEELWFNEWEFKGRPWDYYGKPDSENPFRKWSPALSAKNFKTPTLVIHGQLDYRLDVSEGFQLFTTLQRLKVPSKMLYFPDEGHWVLKPQNSRLWYKTVNDWVDQWTANSFQ